MWFFKGGKRTSKQGKLALPWGNVWYELAGPTNTAPLIVLHGGPGFPHNYLRPLLKLSDTRAVLFYDQFGCGRSGRSDDVSLWSVERFADELEMLIGELGIREYHLLGHSWGTALALEHALRGPSGLKSTIMASPFFSATAWLNDMKAHRAALSEKIQEILDRHERLGMFYTEEFRRATGVFYEKHVYRITPHDVGYEEAAKEMGAAVYNTMWGPTEFIINGSLKDYDRTARLCDLRVPTLLTCGRWDEARPETVEGFRKLIPNATMKVFENSSHMAHLEETKSYIDTIRAFLDAV